MPQALGSLGDLIKAEAELAKITGRRRDLESLTDITFYGRQALSFVSDVTQDEFEMDGKTQSALRLRIIQQSKDFSRNLFKLFWL